MNSLANGSFAEVCILGALDKTLHYEIPASLHGKIDVGSLVLVPLRNKEAAGLVLDITDTLPKSAQGVRIKRVRAVSDTLPPIPKDLIILSRWISSYYFYPIGQTLQTILPPGIQTRPQPVYRLIQRGNGTLAETRADDLVSLFQAGDLLYLDALQIPAQKKTELEKNLSKWVEKGLVERSFLWSSTTILPRRIKMVRLLSDPPRHNGKTNPNRANLLQLLHSSGGCLPMRELRRRVHNVDYWLQRLTHDGIIETFESEEPRQVHCGQDMPPESLLSLTADQQKAINALLPWLDSSMFQPFVLHGITGSGKTEIYLRLVEQGLKKNRSALILVPEIALSSQLETVFRQRFGPRLAIWHSGLSPAARYEQWLAIAGGKTPVVLGVRSAVFSPLSNVGLIIVDEEHDLSYKQSDRLRYHARDVALMRSKILNVPIVLGSATPSLQSIYHVRQSRYLNLYLPKRIDDRPLPDLEIVDMRRERGPFRFLSQPLQEALKHTVNSGYQALLFLNRRGFATFLLCQRCGQVVQCQHCSVSLTYHQKDNSLYCHYCGFTMPPPRYCATCKNPSLLFFGMGTERIEQEVRRLLPDARIVRIDRDTASRPKELVKLLNAVRRHRADVLIGTQMIAKGHDFPNITLVGVVNADISLQIADFRAGENTVQLLTQVAGRAGRGTEPGKVILQTYNPQHYTIQSVKNMDYSAFCDHELRSRKELQYPPYTRFVKLLITASSEMQAKLSAQQLAVLCRNQIRTFKQQNRHLAILGPAPAPINKLKDRYRWHLYVKGWSNRDIQEFIEIILSKSREIRELRKTEVAVDRDPVSSY